MENNVGLLSSLSATAAHIFEVLFALFDRDGSGYADEADVLAALQCAVTSAEVARKKLARVSEDGHVDQPKFQVLLEGCVPQQLANDPTARYERLIKLVLAVVRDFERRATDRAEFSHAAEARACAQRIRAAESKRSYHALQQRQQDERSGIKEAQVVEALEFNRAWAANMDEYESRASHVVQSLRGRHEKALDDFVRVQRPQLQQRFTRHSKETLESMRVQERLVKSGQYVAAGRYSRKVSKNLRRDDESAGDMAEEELEKKLEVLRWQQQLELRGLILRVDRGRNEHRGHWEQGATRLVLAQKNTITDLSVRQSRESSRASQAVRSQLEPFFKPLCVVRGDSRRQGGTYPPQQPAPMQRPSRILPDDGRPFTSSCLASPLASERSVHSTTGSRYLRPFTSEHVPMHRAELTPRPLTSRN